MSRNSPTITIIFAGLAFLLPLAVYLYTICPTVPAGDGGELICAAHDLGIAHPTGYPLFCLLGRIFSLLLPLSVVALRLNVMSAVFCSLAAVMTFFLAGEMIRSPGREKMLSGHLTALMAGLILAFSETFWAQAVQTEVYALHAFLVSSVLLVLVVWLRTGRVRLAWLAAFLLGLSLTNHTSAVIMGAPFLVVLIRHRKRIRTGRVLPGLLLFFLVGISLYLYLPWRSALEPPNDWGNPETIGRLWNHLTARLYHRHFVLTTPAAVVRNLHHYFTTLSGQFGPMVFLLGLPGAVWLALRRRTLFLLLLLTWAANVLLAASYDITDIKAYYLPSSIVWSLWIAGGIFAALVWAIPRLGRAGSRLLSIIVPVVLVAAPLSANISQVSQRGETIARDYGSAILDCAEPRAVVLSFSDSEHFPVLYLHQVEGLRPDLTILGLTSTEAQLRRFIGPREDLSTLGQGGLLRMIAEGSAQPVTIAKEHMSPQHDVIQASGFHLQPYGLVYHLDRDSTEVAGQQRPWPGFRQEAFGTPGRRTDYRALRMEANYYLAWGEDLLAAGDSLAALESFSTARTVIEKHPLSILHSEMAVFFRRIGWLPGAMQEYHRALASPWKSIRDESYIHGNYANLLAEAGDRAGAQREWERALQIWPDNREAQFNLARFRGNRYLRQGRYREAAEQFDRMLLIDPRNAAICYNLGALHAHRLNDPRRAEGYFRKCLEIDPEGAAAAAAREELRRLRSGGE
jgi:tetratricopeptide (TPR) repeat protein